MKKMKDFPEFMKNELNQINNKLPVEKNKDGYYFEGEDGSQMVIYTYKSDTATTEHIHKYDEYLVCISGEYTLTIDGEEICLKPGDEYLIPENTLHKSHSVAGTRTIHAFGGKRINKQHHVFTNYFK